MKLHRMEIAVVVDQRVLKVGMQETGVMSRVVEGVTLRKEIAGTNRDHLIDSWAVGDKTVIQRSSFRRSKEKGSVEITRTLEVIDGL